MTSRGSDIGLRAKTAGNIHTVLHTWRFGPPGSARVLAIHGLTGHGKRWEPMFSRHLPDTCVLAPDLLGHGRSSWDPPWTIEANVAALAAVVDDGSAGPVVVVGHSFGAAIALSLAATRPDLVAGLVLLDPAVGLNGRWMREIADGMFASPDYTDRAEARAEKAHGSWGDVADDVLDRELDEHLVNLPHGRVGWRISIPAMLSYWSELTRPAALPGSVTPTTLVRAMRTNPPYVTDELIAALHAAMPSSFTLLEWDCDHMVPLAKPAESAQLISDRLA